MFTFAVALFDAIWALMSLYIVAYDTENAIYMVPQQKLHIRSSSFLSLCSRSKKPFSTQFGVVFMGSFSIYSGSSRHKRHIYGFYYVNCTLEVTVSLSGYHDYNRCLRLNMELFQAIVCYMLNFCRPTIYI